MFWFRSVERAGWAAPTGRAAAGRRVFWSPRKGRQEKAHETYFQRTADFRPGEDLRADQVPRRPRKGETRLRPRHVRVTSQGKRNFTKFRFGKKFKKIITRQMNYTKKLRDRY